jgi:hypothetical protein
MLGIKLKNDRNLLRSITSSTSLEEIRERSHIIMDLERRTYARSDFESLCSGCRDDEDASDTERCSTDDSTSTSDRKASQDFRIRVCEWSYRVVDHFDMDREVVLTSVYFFDKFLSSQETGCNSNFIQLIAMTSLFLASKLYGPKPSAISMEYLAFLSRSEFTTGHLTQMEMLLLRSLKWHVHPPTAKAAVQEFLALIATTQSIEEAVLKDISKYAHFFTELSVFDISLVGIRSIVIAMASLSNSWLIVSEESPDLSGSQSLMDDCYRFLQLHEEYDLFEDLGFVQSRLWELFSQTEEYFMCGQHTLRPDEPRTKRQRLGEDKISPATVTILNS